MPRKITLAAKYYLKSGECMSRLAKNPIAIPEGVSVDIAGNRVRVSGPKGTLEKKMRFDLVGAEVQERGIQLRQHALTKFARALSGTYASLIRGMIRGVTQGFEKKLESEGVGYRASVEGDMLVLSVGFSHPVRIKQPDGIKFSVEKNTITVSGIDKQLVGSVAASVRVVRKPEPYKGTGIRYQGEVIRRKAGKKAAGITSAQ